MRPSASPAKPSSGRAAPSQHRRLRRAWPDPGWPASLAMEWRGQDLAQRLRRGLLVSRDALLVVQRAAEARAPPMSAASCTAIKTDRTCSTTRRRSRSAQTARFGIARRQAAANIMTHTGIVVGSPEYMAPERARGERGSPRPPTSSPWAAFYARCLTGEPPFIAEHIAAVLVRILFEEPIDIAIRLPSIPPAVATLLRDMLHKDPAQRIADAAAVLARLAALGAVPDLPPSMTLLAPPRPASVFARINKRCLAWSWRQSRSPRGRARRRWLPARRRARATDGY